MEGRIFDFVPGDPELLDVGKPNLLQAMFQAEPHLGFALLDSLNSTLLDARRKFARATRGGLGYKRAMALAERLGRGHVSVAMRIHVSSCDVAMESTRIAWLGFVLDQAVVDLLLRLNRDFPEQYDRLEPLAEPSGELDVLESLAAPVAERLVASGWQLPGHKVTRRELYRAADLISGDLDARRLVEHRARIAEVLYGPFFDTVPGTEPIP